MLLLIALVWNAVFAYGKFGMPGGMPSGIPGGWSAVSVDDPGVIKAAKYAISQSIYPIKCYTILSAESQV